MEIQAKEELNQLTSMVKYIEAYNSQMESEIKVTSTTGHVVEKKIRENEMKKLKQDVAILKANKKKGKDNNDTESDDAQEMFEKQFPLATIDDFDALETSISSSASKRAWLVSSIDYFTFSRFEFTDVLFICNTEDSIS